MKIKAFTLLEVVLAMMLAAIVIGMAYTGFGLMSRLYGEYRKKNLAYADVQLLRQALQRDVEKAALLHLEERQLTFSTDTAGGLPEQLRYQWTADQLLRSTALGQDTFRLKGLQLQAFFEGRAALEGLADRLELRFVQDSVAMQMSIHKNYDSKSLFNKKEEQWNP